MPSSQNIKSRYFYSCPSKQNSLQVFIITLKQREVTHSSLAQIFENLFPNNREGEKTMVLFVKLFSKYHAKS